MEQKNATKIIDRIVESDPRYSLEAYVFIGEAVNRTIRQMVEDGGKRHITGGELLEGIRTFAIDEFGPMSEFVLRDWGLRETIDIGNVVFNMVENQLLNSSDNDSINDFKGVFERGEELSAPFNPSETSDVEIEAVDI
ncbi:MAG: hypothetical protein KAG97_06150 [Victivallales bacterium]|nr:hypothetical protein [Victivallales bacterium]